MEITKDSIRLAVEEESQITSARRTVAALLKSMNFSEKKISDVSIIVTELGTNLIKHCSGGELIVRVIKVCDYYGLEIISVDNGPGIKDISLAMKDGFTTAGTLGGGLGAIKRLSKDFDFYTQAGKGSIFLSRIYDDRFYGEINKHSLEFSAISIPKDGEDVNGDGYDIEFSNTGAILLLVDGLGHGISAFEASTEAIKIFKNYYTEKVLNLMERINKALFHTRGCAGIIALINAIDNIVNFVGIGNISAFIIDDSIRKTMVSQNGIIGENIFRIKESSYNYNDNSVLIFHSDGISANWNLKDYPGIEYRDPAILAGILYRDFARGNDDLTVIVGRKKKKAE